MHFKQRTQADNNDVLAYWLSNSSTLLLLLQRTLKPSVAQSFRGIPQAVDLSYVSSSSGGRSGSISHVEAKHPALLFKQQLTEYIEKIYGMIRDNLKKEICPSLVSIIQAPKKSRGSLLKGDLSPTKNIGGQQDLIGHWQDIARSLTNFLNTLKANNVPPFLVRKVFVQIFTFINVKLFNSILLSKELCSLSNGEYVKEGLTELEQWCVGATYEYAGIAYDELKHTRQAIDFFVIHQKSKKTFDEITHDLCPTLSMQQLYRISTSYRDDKNGTHSLAQNVISKLRVLLTDDSYRAGSNQFLLHDDSRVPFSVDDISQSVKQIDISNLEPPLIIRENTMVVVGLVGGWVGGGAVVLSYS
ncbi:myosin-9-like [Carex rostrata]